ncbi:MAG: sulfatase [Daejeonella sp.]
MINPSIFKAYFLTMICILGLFLSCFSQNKDNGKKPNILFCIADDASYQHMSAYGLNDWVKTPAFDRVAKEGLLFTRAYTPNAKCSPSRAIILTGRNSWQLEDAANHNSYFPAKFTTFTDALKENNYFVGFTGKGWGPGDPGKINGKSRMLTGKEYSKLKLATPTKTISPIDYAANFEQFLKDKPKDQSFCFWFGSHEPHRGYEYGSGLSKGNKQLSDIDKVPPFWIDNERVRTDMLDYAYEVEYFDQNLKRILDVLGKSGELENTIVVVTSDNGMPFPRVKGHVYAHDNHLPLAIMWKGHIQDPGRKITDFISFADFAPTFLALAGVNPSKVNMQPIQGKSILPIINSKSGSQIDQKNDHVLLGRERAGVGRPHDEGYPVRAIVKGDFFYSVNYEPGRWPSGNPETGYLDTDSSPTKTALLAANRKGEHKDLWQLSFGKKDEEELYNIEKDPYSIKNLANDPAYASVKNKLRAQMEQELKSQQDPRMFGKGDIFDRYPLSKSDVKDYYERYMKGEKMRIRSKGDID